MLFEFHQKKKNLSSYFKNAYFPVILISDTSNDKDMQKHIFISIVRLFIN